MVKMKTYTLEELTDKYIGKIGTPKRDKFDADLKEELQAYHIGEAIKQARKANNLTQEQLGERIGVQKAQISRLERGKNVTITSMMRVFRAMNITATLEVSGVGKVALC